MVNYTTTDVILKDINGGYLSPYVKKVGTETVGTDDTPVYLDAGIPTAGKKIGITSYDNTKTYNLNNVVLNIEGDVVKLYRSLVNNNTSALTDDTKWKEAPLGGGGEIGDMGFAPLGIDESLNLRRYMNGQVISQTQFVAFTSKIKSAIALYPSLATTEENWQSEKTNSKLGQCGKFVVDDTTSTIRLPCVVNAQGLVDLALIGGIKSESLPQHTHNLSLLQAAGRTWNIQGTAFWGGDDATRGPYNATTTNASSSTYQDNAPVRQEAVQYPYYIQVATGVEETLPAIREYKINTPFFFGQSMYSDVAPSNTSWLASNGQYNARTIYPDYYDWLNSKIGQVITANGGKVVSSTDTITDYDFVVNTTDQTFRLPLKTGYEIVPDWGNAQNIASSLPFTSSSNGYIYGDGLVNGADAPYLLNGILVGVSRGSSAWSSNGTVSVFVKKGDVFNSTANFSESDSFGLHFIPAVGNGTLYYYVGDIVQDASLINAGAVLGQLSTKTNFVEAAEASMPSGKYIDLTLGASGTIYTAPANGWFVLHKDANGVNQYVYMYTIGIDVGTCFNVSSATDIPSYFLPVKAGDTVQIDYTLGGATRQFRFVYAEGDQ